MKRSEKQNVASKEYEHRVTELEKQTELFKGIQKPISRCEIEMPRRYPKLQKLLKMKGEGMAEM